MKRAALAIAVAAIVAAALWAFEPVRVTSDSMLPALRGGALLWVNKLAYRLRDPQRGEVVVLRVSREGEGAQRFVKRIIGLPGERLDFIEEVIFIDGDPLRRQSVGSFEDEAGQVFGALEVELGTRRFRVLDDPERSTLDGSYTLSANEYFVLGDHRDHSEDSRSFGPVSRDRLQGPVLGLD